MKKLAALLCVVGIVGCAMVGWASPATGVTPTVLSRATFDPFHLNRDPHSLVEFEARAKSPLDFVVRQHDYLPHSSTGWHSHPGPVFISVTKGTLTFYEYRRSYMLSEGRRCQTRIRRHGTRSYRFERDRRDRPGHLRHCRACGDGFPQRACRTKSVLRLLGRNSLESGMNSLKLPAISSRLSAIAPQTGSS